MQIGGKVKYIGASEEQIKWGNCTDSRELLKVGDIFIVTDIEEHKWHTKISIQGCDGKFNAVCFEEVEETTHDHL